MDKGTNIPQGYKDSPLGVIPEDWEVKRLEDISFIKGGYAFNSTTFKPQGKFQVIKMSNLYEGDLNLKRSESFIDELRDVEKEFLLKPNDILITLTGTIGKRDYGYTFQISDQQNLLLNQRVAKIHATKSDDKYLYFFTKTLCFLNSFYLSSRGGTGNQSNVSTIDLGRIKILYPPLPEQQKIAEILSCWDEAIEKQTRLIKKLETRKHGLMQQLLTGKKRLKGFEGEWKIFHYNDVIKEVQRRLQWNETELYELISVKRRSGGLFLREPLYGHQIKTKKLRPAFDGDFLISKMQIVHGASGLTTKEFHEKKISDSYIAVISKDKDILNIEYFNWISKMPYFYHQTYISSYGVHIEKMTFDFETFMSLRVRLPSIQEQTAIANILSSANEETQKEKEKLSALNSQKKGLMQQLLIGNTRVKI